MTEKEIGEIYGSREAYEQHQEYGQQQDKSVEKKTPHRKFLLSTIALGVGWLVFFSRLGTALRPVNLGFGEVVSMDFYIHNMHLGLQIVLGTLAYRSKKRVRLGIRPKEKIRTALEWVALTIVVGIFVHFYNSMATMGPAQMLLKTYIAHNSAYVSMDIIALVWILIAYWAITFKSYSK